MPFLYDMTTSFLYPYAFIQSINMLYMNEMILLYDVNTFLLYAHDSFSGTNMPHEWYAFPIWHDYLFPLSICFFLKYKHATWMIWLLYDMNTLLLYAHASFSGTNMPHEWYAFPIWHDYLFPLSICLCKSINMLYINDMILLYDMNTFLLYVHCTCFFFRNQHATWIICLSYMTWLPLSSIHMLFSICFGYPYLIWTPFTSMFMILWCNIAIVTIV